MDEFLGIHVPPPRDDFRIRETHVSSALRKDPLPGIDYSFNPYVGCYHGCLFCYVPRLLQIARSTCGASVVVKRNAPTVLPREGRLRCLRALADAGLTTFVGFAPAYPPTGGWTPEAIAEAFAKAGVKKMFTRALDARWGVPEAMARQLDGSELAEDLRRIGDPETIVPFVTQVGEECRARGIDFRNSFEFRRAESNSGFGSPDTEP